MREGRWRWWRDQGSQRKRSLHAWVRWDKHLDILSRAMCARNECDSRNRTRTKKTNNYAHIHVLPKCVTSWLSGFMGFVLMLLWDLGFHGVIGVGRLTVQQEGFIRQLHITTHTQFQVQSSFLLDVVLWLCFCHRQLNPYPKFLHMSHRETGSFEVLSLHLPSVTVDRRHL